MISAKPILEAPTVGPLPSVPTKEKGRDKEPVLAVDQIQGNIFPGFNKDFQAILFLRITDPAAFASWLADLIPHVATMGQVVQFNRLFKAIRSQQQSESKAPKITWLNVAISFAGLKKLKPKGVQIDDFKDEAFKAGQLKQSQQGVLGDPVGTGKPGDPENWVVGGPGREADVILLVAGDDREDLFQEVARIASTLFISAKNGDQIVSSGAELIFRQDGATLNGPLRGHEHFGFRDGISQPGIRGMLPDGSFLTPGQNPKNVNQGKPGQDLLWPGEFVFGYSGQDGTKDVEDEGTDPLKNPKRKAPAEFARNGSFVVFRRLRQHVGMLHRFLQSVAARFQVAPEFVGAKMVGRWASGAPSVVTPDNDDPVLASDDCRNNNFEFGNAGDTPKQRPPRDSDCQNVADPANDPDGLKLPFAGHIRKAYPRDDTSPDIAGLKESTTQTHRLLRRGIPYGEQSASTPHQPSDDDEDRGLLFMAYQVSIVDQFEFVTQKWVNNADFKQKGVGFDPIIGQNDKDPNRQRLFGLNLPGETDPISTDDDWVVPTGGGYFFAPSISALQLLAGAPHQETAKARSSARKSKKRKKN